MRCAPVVYITLLLVVLAAVLLTYPKLPPAPDPALARFTNYPAWHSTLKEWDQQQIDMTGAFTIMLVFLCTFYSFKWTMYDNVASKNTAAYIYDGTQLHSALPFDRLLAWYTLATHISGWAYVLLDIGKLWGAFGLLHNTGEVVILLLLHDGGRIRRNRYFYLVGGYMSIVFLGIVYLDWPKDAIFFKTQGQCIDWSLLIAFVRVALETRRRVREGRVVLPQNANDVVPDDIVPDDVVPDDIVPDEDDAPSTDSTINNVDHPKQLWILVAAAFVHIVGNVAATIGPDTGKYFLIFMHSYYISFPLYAYYIFLDTHSRAAVPKHIYVYRDPAWKTAALVIVSIILSLLTMRLAFMGLS